MSLTVPMTPGMKEALEAEAAARNTTCERAACEVIDDFFRLHGVREGAWDAWLKAKVEESREAARQGDICSHDEVRRDMAERRAKLLALIAAK